MYWKFISHYQLSSFFRFFRFTHCVSYNQPYYVGIDNFDIKCWFPYTSPCLFYLIYKCCKTNVKIDFWTNGNSNKNNVSMDYGGSQYKRKSVFYSAFIRKQHSVLRITQRLRIGTFDNEIFVKVSKKIPISNIMIYYILQWKSIR